MNLAKLLEGPANVTHRGQLVHFKGGLTLTPLADLFAIDTDLYGTIDRRALDNSVVLSGIPIGEWTDDMLEMTHRWQNPTIGQLLTPRYDISAIDPATNVVTLVGALSPRIGCPIRWATLGTKPAVIDLATTYYWGTADKVYPTAADAVGGTNAIDFADDGDDDQMIIEQEPVVIDAISANRRITFHNGAVSVMPPIILSAIQSIFGSMSFACFIKNDAAWSDANSLYTVSKASIADSAPDPDDIPTQEYQLGWGAAPWDSFRSRGPVQVTPQLGLEPIGTDGRGSVGMKISGLNVSASFQPQDFSEQQMLDLLGLQGGAVARGKSRVRDDLVITGTGVDVRVYNASPRELPQTFQATGPRAGQLAADGHLEIGTGYFRAATAAP